MTGSAASRITIIAPNALPLRTYQRACQLTIFVLLKNSDLLPQTPSISTIGKPFTQLSTVDSTNNYAMARIRDGLATPGEVYFAFEQTAGKGQRGKRWTTSRGENILMSVVLAPSELNISQQFLLSATVALGCYDFFKKWAGEEMTRLKWPNDLYWQDRKAGGILIESGVGSREWGVISSESGVRSQESGVSQVKWKWAVVGIGININQTSFDPAIFNAVSLKQITGKNFDVVEIAQELCSCLDIRYKQIFEKTALSIMEDYNSVLYRRGQLIRLKKDSAVFETLVESVDINGRLHTKDSIPRTFDFGEVEWILH